MKIQTTTDKQSGISIILFELILLNVIRFTIGLNNAQKQCLPSVERQNGVSAEPELHVEGRYIAVHYDTAAADLGFVKREGRGCKCRDAVPALNTFFFSVIFFWRHLHYAVYRGTVRLPDKNTKQKQKTTKNGRGRGRFAPAPPPPWIRHCTTVAPFWLSTEHRYTSLTPFWLFAIMRVIYNIWRI